MKKIISSLFLFALIASAPANAAISFRIDDVNVPKVKILINGGRNSNNPNIKKSLDEISNAINKNLSGTDLFEVSQRPVSVVSITDPNNELSVEKVPNFPSYSSSGVDMLLVMDASFNPSGELELKARFWDVLDERQLFGKFYSSNQNNYQKLANLISDEIFKVVSGEKVGHFDSKIVYVAESGNALKRIKRVAIMNFDGSNHRYLTSGRELVLTPNFAGQKDEILFVRFFGEKPQIYNLDIRNALIRKVGGFRGMTFAPTVNPKDPNIIAFSVIDHGNSNLYQMNLFTNEITRLTNTRAIDTTPSFSPDGKQIVFSSDRSGNEQLYVMDANGGSAKRISFDSGNYSKPVWSPDGKYIAFTKLKAGQFSIGIMNPDGKNEKILASGYLVEGARWAPSSRYLVYSRKNSAYGKASIPKLYTIDIVTGFDKMLRTPENEGATDPDWKGN